MKTSIEKYIVTPEWYWFPSFITCSRSKNSPYQAFQMHFNFRNRPLPILDCHEKLIAFLNSESLHPWGTVRSVPGVLMCCFIAVVVLLSIFASACCKMESIYWYFSCFWISPKSQTVTAGFVIHRFGAFIHSCTKLCCNATQFNWSTFHRNIKYIV